MEELDVPVFGPITAYYKTIEEWEADDQGIGAGIAWSVALPEFEGVIEPLIVGGGMNSKDQVSGEEIEQRQAIAERCQRLALRVAQWVRLRRTPVTERKVAFVLHNNPCASVEATVGVGAHLDTLESVTRILAQMKACGYQVEAPEDGKELIDTIMARKAISEFRWTTVDEIVSKGGALGRVGLSDYLKWWETFPEKTKKRISQAWGNPPGEEVNGIPPAMVYEDAILVTGIDYGNAVVCVQPKRGCAGPKCDGRVCKILHDPDVPPPHQYLATYRYLEDTFGAHVVVHVGTHGNLEFLPGKGVGLSESCLPDLAIHTLPHLYIYNADNPPEGTIAKRRSCATLVDHMQTVMQQGGLYEGLEALDRLLGEYEQAKITDRGRAHTLEHMIVESIEKTDLAKEIRFKPDDPFEETVRKTHEALGRIRNTQIQDGMHIFGRIPEGDQRIDFINAILRFDAGEKVSLRKMICRAMGLELADLLKDQGAVHEDWALSHGQLLEEIDGMGRKTIDAVLASSNGRLRAQVAELLGARLKDETALDQLEIIGERILDLNTRIEASKEIDALLHGFEGGYLPSGPSGLITRGRDDILPTGRNFFSLDPEKVPTQAAFKVGEKLAAALIAKHEKEENRIPENVAIFWMCTDIMWSDGEGMGQIMALIGVKPVWLPNGKVKTFEIIPLEELKRPRVDVTIRASGISRDNFPNCLDAASGQLRWNWVYAPMYEGHKQLTWRGMDISEDGCHVALFAQDGRAFFLENPGLAEPLDDRPKLLWQKAVTKLIRVGEMDLYGYGAVARFKGPYLFLASGTTHALVSKKAAVSIQHPLANTLFAFDRRGKLLWMHKLGGLAYNVEISDDLRYLLMPVRCRRSQNETTHQGVYLFDLNVPGGGAAKLLWHYNMPGICLAGSLSGGGRRLLALEYPLDMDLREEFVDVRGAHRVYCLR